jgi:hypothetical protein
VEELLRYGEIRHPDLVEWGLPTVDALLEVAAALPGMPLIASGGVRSGLDVAKAIALGARAAAIARPLLAPALDSADAVEDALAAVVEELRLVMHLVGTPDVRVVGHAVLATSCRLTPMDLQIAGKTALVTGASKGIGFAVAAALAAEGVRLVVNGRDAGALAEAAERLRAGGAEVHPVAGDVAQAKALKALLAATREAIGDPAILVSNAGGPATGAAAALDDAAWAQGFELTLMSAVRLARAVVPAMKRERLGAGPLRHEPGREAADRQPDAVERVPGGRHRLRAHAGERGGRARRHGQRRRARLHPHGAPRRAVQRRLRPCPPGRHDPGQALRRARGGRLGGRLPLLGPQAGYMTGRR